MEHDERNAKPSQTCAIVYADCLSAQVNDIMLSPVVSGTAAVYYACAIDNSISM